MTEGDHHTLCCCIIRRAPCQEETFATSFDCMPVNWSAMIAAAPTAAVAAVLTASALTCNAFCSVSRSRCCATHMGWAEKPFASSRGCQ